ncbi:MAG TPA: UDP-2,3-diacylglucosamine diphosphatase [Flavobacteriales bacterium]
MKRKVDLLVLSDLHLGTYGCRAKELNDYLRTVRPGKVVLNGDILDIWQLDKRWFPEDHMQVVKRLMKLAAKIPVYYITGNHDEALRKYSPARLGRLRLLDQLTLDLDGVQHWFIHGDIFDVSMKNAKWLAKLGGIGYDQLIRLNHIVNVVLRFFGRPRTSFSKRIKQSVKSAVKYIADYEVAMAEFALRQGHQAVVCGHIHQPRIGTVQTEKGEIRYLNSGDWIENMTALEYNDGEWRLHTFVPDMGVPRRRPEKKGKRVQRDLLNELIAAQA